MIHYKQCPVCGGDSISAVLSAKDHTISAENFSICKCAGCTLMFTQDVPGQNAIGPYYASDNYISHSDTDKGFVNRLYHAVRKRTLQAKRRLVQRETHLPAGVILDIGCGTGAFLNEMQTNKWTGIGLEPDETARNNAQRLYNISPLSPDNLFKLEHGSVDAISMWHVLEHVHQLQEYVVQMEKLLRPGGRIFIAVPNYTSHDAQHYKEDWAAYDVPRHLYHFSPQSMRRLMQVNGLTVEKIKPMWYDAFYVSMLSEQYKNGKGNIIAAFLTGLVSNINTLFDKERCSSLIYVIKKTTT
ncbi:MAG: Methyltransferase type 12 [Ferruginibacter sp.]|nr:Methyltransferase type 12 [Ferruginibacter sp.]